MRLLTVIKKKLSGSGGLARTLHSFSWLMAEKGLTLAVALFVNIPVARYLGPSNYGLWNYVFAVAALVTPIATLGLANIVTKELLDHPEAEGEVMGTVMTLRKAAAAVAIVGVVAYALIHTFPDERLGLYLVIAVAATLIGNPAVFQNWFVAHHKLQAYTTAAMIRTLLFSAARLYQVFSGASLTAFVVLAAVEALVGGSSVWIAYKWINKSPVKWTWNKALGLKLLSKSWPLTISSLTAAVYLKLDTILLTQMASAAEAGIYSAAARLSEIWYFVPALLMNAMFPTLLSWKKKSADIYQTRLQDVLDLFAAIGTCVAVVISLASPLIVHLLFGPQYAPAAAILSIHVWSGIFIFMRALLSKWMIAEDLYIFSLVTHGAGAVVNVLLNLYLIPHYGGLGAAVSTVISYATASYLALLLHPRTRKMFWMMTIALAWPRRVPDLIKLLTNKTAGHA